MFGAIYHCSLTTKYLPGFWLMTIDVHAEFTDNCIPSPNIYSTLLERGLVESQGHQLKR
jgi:hypothetical protein